MFENKRICVVVPAYNEEKLISKVITTMPEYVDRIVVIDDLSTDNTVKIVRDLQVQFPEKLILIQHEKNIGPGGAVATGYQWAIDNEMDITAVMAGDAQMDPEQLQRYLAPIAAGQVDYTKGNRLFTEKAWKTFPKARYIGSAVLSLLTKIASGYWHIADPQNGYTAISLSALKMINLKKLYRRYGLPNLVLVDLNIYQFRVCDIHTKPIYGVGEKSSINLFSATFFLSMILIKSFFWRMKEKFIIRDFHPLVLLYMLGIITFPIGVIFGVDLMLMRLLGHHVAATSALFAAFLSISGLQSLCFAIWFDIEYSKSSEKNIWI